jgi:hypothetical protein
MKLIPETLQEAIRFQRGSDPKKSLDIGITTILNKITSEDLEQLNLGWDPHKKRFSEEIYREEMGDFSEDMPEEYKQGVDWMEKVDLALRNKIEFGERFSNDEEQDMLDYLLVSKPPDKPYAYNYSIDPWEMGVLWSAVKLPSATPVEYGAL